MEETKKEKIFADGFKFETIPDGFKDKIPWIKGRLSIMVPDAVKFLEKYQKVGGWVNLNLCKSNKGTYYLELNQWEPKEKEKAITDIPF